MIHKSKIKQIIKLIIILILVLSVLILFGLFIFFNKNSSKKTKATNNEGASVTLQLSKQYVKKDEDITITIKATSSAEIRVIGYLGTLVFDKSKFQVKDIQYKLGVVSKDLGDETASVSAVNQLGKVYLQGEIQSAQGHILSGQTDIASITLVASGEVKPQFSFINIKFYRINIDNTLSELPSNDVDSSQTTGAVSIKMKLKLQGFVAKAGKTVNVKVKLGGGGLSAPTTYQAAVFSSGQDGVWTGAVNFDSIPVGTGYYILVKGGKHIQRKICDLSPVETDTKSYHCSEGKLNLAEGENNFDLTGILQFAGDLNLETGQDGGVNAADFSYISKAINSKTPIDAATIERGDINFDGSIDSQDFSLMNKTMELGMNKDEE